jgi:hypothetical protein
MDEEGMDFFRRDVVLVTVRGQEVKVKSNRGFW